MVEHTFKILRLRLRSSGKPPAPSQRGEAMIREGEPAREVAPALELRGVSKWFGRGGGRTVALRGVDLDMRAGEFLSIVGPSGCGKSTLLRIVADLVEPSEGSVKVKGRSARQARENRDLGVVFQTPVLYEWRSVARNVQLPLEVMGFDAAERRRRVRQMLELVGLQGFEKHAVWQLSGGMQQRVSIARALSFDPSLLLMSSRPGSIDYRCDIPLPRPRTEATREQDDFFHLTGEIRGHLRSPDGVRV